MPLSGDDALFFARAFLSLGLTLLLMLDGSSSGSVPPGPFLFELELPN